MYICILEDGEGWGMYGGWVGGEQQIGCGR